MSETIDSLTGEVSQKNIADCFFAQIRVSL